jgi:5-methylcytosine-specific restriction protein A
MPTMPKTHRPLGAPTPQVRARLDRLRRGTRHEQGYTNVWSRARDGYLDRHPLCVYCAKANRVMAANVVDHIVPHRGNLELFWNEDNWQSLCAPCHNSTKRREENAARRLAANSSAIGRDQGGGSRGVKVKAVCVRERVL